MKILSAAAAAVLLAAAAPAATIPTSTAGTIDDGSFYIGLGGRIDALSWKEAEDTNYPQSLMGLGLRFGYSFSPYLAVETGFSLTSDDQRQMDDSQNRMYYRMTIREAQLDAYGYLPLGGSGRFRPFITAGMAFDRGFARIRNVPEGSSDKPDAPYYTERFKKNEFNWRAGGGIAVRLSDDVETRIYARYQSYSFGALNGGAVIGFDVNVAVF